MTTLFLVSGVAAQSQNTTVEEPGFFEQLVDRFFDEEISDEIPSADEIVVENISVKDTVPLLGTIVPGGSDGVVNPDESLTYEADVSLDNSASDCSLYPDEVTMDTWLKVGAIHYTISTGETVDIPCEGSVSLSKSFPAPTPDDGNRQQDFEVQLLMGDSDEVGHIGDNEGAIVADSDSVTVYEEIAPPTASIDAPSSVTLGESFSLDASGSSGEDLSYSWDVDGRSETGESVSTSFDSEGFHTVELTVEDWQGQTDTASTTIEAELEDVDANIDGAGSSTVGEEVEFDGQFSQGHDGISSYTWSIEGETVSSSSSFTRTFEQPGDYTVELTVEDGAGQRDTTTETHTVSATDPSASFSVPSSVEAGETVTLDASESSRGSYPIEQYNWDVAGKSLSGETVSYSFSEGGQKQIELEVVDSQGNTATQSGTILVETSGPQAVIDTASADLDQVVAGEPIGFEAGKSSTGSSGITQYEWSISGELYTGDSVTHSFDEPGGYTVELTVVDDQGRSASTSETVNVIEADCADCDGNETDEETGSQPGDSEDDSGGTEDGSDTGGGSDDESDDTDDSSFFGNLWDSIWRILTFG